MLACAATPQDFSYGCCCCEQLFEKYLRFDDNLVLATLTSFVTRRPSQPEATLRLDGGGCSLWVSVLTCSLFLSCANCRAFVSNFTGLATQIASEAGTALMSLTPPPTQLEMSQLAETLIREHWRVTRLRGEDFALKHLTSDVVMAYIAAVPNATGFSLQVNC